MKTEEPLSWPDPFEAEWRVLRMQAKLHQWAADDPGRRFDDRSAGARTGVIAGSVAVRLDHNAAKADTEADDEPVQPTGKRIEYVIAVPDDPRWLSRAGLGPCIGPSQSHR